MKKKIYFQTNQYILNQNLSELFKIDKYFLLFEKTEEVFNSFKKLFSDKHINLIEEEKQMKIKIHNSITNKYFCINIPKIKPIIDEIKGLYNYISLLEKKYLL